MHLIYLQETNAKLSKLRLQAKAKATKETKAKKAAAAVEEPTDQVRIRLKKSHTQPYVPCDNQMVLNSYDNHIIIYI